MHAKKIIIFLTFFLILISGILTKQNPLFIIPLFVSLFVMSFQAEVNRIAYLLGGINSCIYGIVYLCLGLYASAASAFLFSFPFQLATFINWKKRPYEKATIFKKLSTKSRIVLTFIFLFVFVLFYLILKMTKTNYAILDNATSLVGITVNILCLLAYIEYSYLQILSAVFTIALNIQVTVYNPSHITYLIYSFYCLYCFILAFIKIKKTYKKQLQTTIS